MCTLSARLLKQFTAFKLQMFYYKVKVMASLYLTYRKSCRSRNWHPSECGDTGVKQVMQGHAVAKKMNSIYALTHLGMYA